MATETTANTTVDTDLSAKYRPSKFVYAEQVFKGLEIAFANNENILLYGKGGFARI